MILFAVIGTQKISKIFFKIYWKYGYMYNRKKKIFKKKYWKMSRNYKHLIDILVRLTPTFHEIMLERLVGSLM